MNLGLLLSKIKEHITEMMRGVPHTDTPWTKRIDSMDNRAKQQQPPKIVPSATENNLAMTSTPATKDVLSWEEREAEKPEADVVTEDSSAALIGITEPVKEPLTDVAVTHEDKIEKKNDEEKEKPPIEDFSDGGLTFTDSDSVDDVDKSSEVLSAESSSHEDGLTERIDSSPESVAPSEGADHDAPPEPGEEVRLTSVFAQEEALPAFVPLSEDMQDLPARHGAPDELLDPNDPELNIPPSSDEADRETDAIFSELIKGEELGEEYFIADADEMVNALNEYNSTLNNSTFSLEDTDGLNDDGSLVE